MIRTYSELILIPTFKERFKYLNLSGFIGKETFGFDRVLNQIFYRSKEWKNVRREVIIRDNGCDLGIEDREIHGLILVHHMNPINQNEILSRSSEILDPEFLICVSKTTHNAIHYGDESLLIDAPTVRRPNDTNPWR